MADPTSAVLLVQEADYLYGVGPLSLRVEHVHYADPQQYDGDVWLRVDGTQIGRRGAELGRRSVMIRARRLPVALRTPSRRPGN